MEFCLSRLGLIRYMCVVACAAFLMCAGAPKLLADVWTVSGVEVDVTAENAPQAKVIAIGEAQIIAFRRLVDRVVPTKSSARLKKLKPETIGRLMAGLSIEEERVAPKRYIAKLSIRFLQNKTKSLFSQYGARFAEQQSEPVLLIPVWLDPDGADMWGKENPWRMGWDALDLKNALVPAILPVGDETDQAAITAADAVNGNWNKLEALRIRYGAASVIVIAAEPKSDISLRGVMFGSSPVGNVAYDQTFSGEDLETAGVAAARAFNLAVQDRWKNENLVTYRQSSETASANVLKLAVPLRSMAEWNIMRSRIQATTGVGRIDVNSLSARGAVISVAFAGSLNELRNSLYQTGFSLQQVGGTWVLQPQ
ncbi:MAG: DUF2066 domain-containing protein [Hyphomicrobiales bacterium]